MTPDYQTLADALQTRLDTIANTELRDSNPEEQLRLLQEVSEQIFAWHIENRGNIPAQLNHFLQQQSLTKALDLLKTSGLVAE